MPHLHVTDPQLFVHLTWTTRDNRPLLGDDQLRQAAYLAITARTRALLCHVLAISGTASQIDMVVCFPASLPIAHLVRSSHEAAQKALERQHEMLDGEIPELAYYWGAGYTAHTLNATEAAQAQTYLRQQLTGEPPIH